MSFIMSAPINLTDGRFSIPNFHSKRPNLAIKYLMLIASLLMIFATVAYPQVETGQIAGTVFDPTGAVIPNAKVTVKSAATGLERQTTTTSNGTFVMTNLQPGKFIVTTQASGFSTVQQTIDLGVGAKVGLDVKVEVGAVQATVEVTEAAGLINSETQTLSQTVTGTEIVQLPTLTRNPYDLVQTVGNVSDAEPTGRGAGVAINGLRATSSNLLLDGVANNNEFAGDIGIRVPLD